MTPDEARIVEWLRRGRAAGAPWEGGSITIRIRCALMFFSNITAGAIRAEIASRIADAIERGDHRK